MGPGARRFGGARPEQLVEAPLVGLGRRLGQGHLGGGRGRQDGRPDAAGRVLPQRLQHQAAAVGGPPQVELRVAQGAADLVEVLRVGDGAERGQVDAGVPQLRGAPAVGLGDHLELLGGGHVDERDGAADVRAVQGRVGGVRAALVEPDDVAVRCELPVRRSRPAQSGGQRDHVVPGAAAEHHQRVGLRRRRGRPDDHHGHADRAVGGPVVAERHADGAALDPVGRQPRGRWDPAVDRGEGGRGGRRSVGSGGRAGGDAVAAAGTRH